MSALIVLLVSTTAAVSTIQVQQCPAELDGASVTMRPAFGWTAIVATRFILSGAGVVLGQPNIESRAELRGDYRQISKHVTETTYNGLDKKEKWLTCSYGAGGELEQAYRLPAIADRCVIHASRNQYNDTRIAVSCTPAGD